MTNNSLGTLYIDLDLRNNISSGLSSAQSQLGSVGSTLSSTGASLTKNVTAPIMAIGAASAYTAITFDDSMRKVLAVSGANTEEFAAMTDQARELGRTTRYTASEAAEGMTYLAMAGFDVNSIMETMPGMLDLAAASGTDLATVADIASNILQGFGMDATEMGHASDVMAAAVASANTNFVQLGEAMSYVAPVSEGFGISMEETTAAIGLMSNAGIQGSMAGTALRGALTRLADPTGEAVEALEKYGIAAEDVNPATHNLAEILGVLEAAGVDTTDMMTIFGQRAGPGMLALLGAGAEGLEEYTADLETADGAAEQMAEDMESGPGGALREMKSALQDVAITLGDVVANSFLPFVDKITDGARALSEFGKAHPTLLKFGVALGILAAAAGPVLMVIGMMASGIAGITGLIGAVGGTAGLTAALGTAGTALATVGGALVAVLPPVLAVVAGAGLLYYTFTHWEEIKKVVSDVWDGIKTTLGSIDFYQSGLDLMSNFADGIKAAASKVYDSAKEVLEDVGKLFPHSPAKEGPFHVLPNWNAIFEGLEEVDAKKYADSALLSASSLVSDAPRAIKGSLEGTTNNYSGGNVTINVQGMTVRSDDDIKEIAKELHKLSNKRTRAAGV